MKTFCRVALAAVLLAFGPVSFGAGARQEAPSAHWVLSPSAQRVSSGGEIEIRVTSRYTTGTALDRDGLHAEYNYRPEGFTVLDSHGNRAPLTALGQKWLHVSLAGSGLLPPTAPPSQPVTETLVLSRFFDLTIPGPYTVWLSKAGMTSNKVSIMVVR